MKPVIKLQNINKKFNEKIIFENYSLEITEGEFVSIVGNSGTGKSTLLNMMGLLDTCDTGNIEILGQKNIKPFSKKASIVLRNDIGYLFQNFALIENETVLYNLEIVFKHIKTYNKEELIKEALQKVGLSGFEHKKIFECSGGEQQRVAIARLLLKPCSIILADEPTGSLDDTNKQEIFKLLLYLNEIGKTIIIATHDDKLVAISKRVVILN